MKICLIIDDYMPDSIKVSAKMMHELACELKEEGHEVMVVTPSPKLKAKREIHLLDGVTVCRFKSGEIKNVGKIKRAINETLLSYHAWKSFKSYFQENPHDLIVYYSPSIFWGGLVSRLKKMWDAPSYLILRDLFPQWAIDKGLIRKNSKIEKYFRHFEKQNYAVADTIGLMSQKNLEWFNEQHSYQYNSEVLFNWTTTESSEVNSSIYREKLKLKNKVIYFYGGNMGHAQDMFNLMRLAKSMQSHIEAHFLFVGIGDEVELMKEFKEKENLTNTTILPPVNQMEFNKILSEIDVGLFSLNADHKTHNFPGKLLGYMRHGKPILGSINPGNDLRDVVEEYKAGYISINGEDDLLYENAIKLLNGKTREDIGNNAKKLLVSKFSVEAAARKITFSKTTM